MSIFSQCHVTGKKKTFNLGLVSGALCRVCIAMERYSHHYVELMEVLFNKHILNVAIIKFLLMQTDIREPPAPVVEVTDISPKFFTTIFSCFSLSLTHSVLLF